MCGSSASVGYGRGGRVKGPVAASALRTFVGKTVAQAAAAWAVVFRAWRRVIIMQSFLVQLVVSVLLPVQSLGQSPATYAWASTAASASEPFQNPFMRCRE